MFPSVINTFNRPNPTDKLNSPSHSALHNTVSSVVGQIETVIGLSTSSAVGTLMYDIRSPDSNGGGHVQSAVKGGTGQTTFTKGDILVATNPSLLSKLAAGPDGTVIQYNSSTASGLQSAGVATAKQIQDQTYVFAQASVLSASVYGITFPTAVSVLGIGQAFEVKWPTTNAGSILAIQVSSLAAQRLVLPDLTNPEVGSIKPSMISRIENDGVNFQISSYSHNIGTGAKNLVQLDGTGALPAVSATNLTNLPSQGQWTKISTVNISATATNSTVSKIAEWTGLTGDTDDEYMLNFETSGNGTIDTSAAYIAIRLNDDGTAAHYNHRTIYFSSLTITALTGSLAQFPIINSTSSNDIRIALGIVNIKASKTIAGTTRLIKSEAASASSGISNSQNQNGGGNWSDVTNQITSIQIYMFQDTGADKTITGIATLYKINR